ncbi:hypothetical protein DSECCO2_657010 [anaerobic digester metagenome]
MFSKSQAHAVGEPEDVSVKATVSGASPEVTFAVKFATGASPPEEPLTVTCAVPVAPPADAVTVVVPGESASKLPVVAFTTPTAVLLLVQVRSAPGILSPRWSKTSAAKFTLPPTSRVTTAGVTSIIAASRTR